MFYIVELSFIIYSFIICVIINTCDMKLYSLFMSTRCRPIVKLKYTVLKKNGVE